MKFFNFINEMAPPSEEHKNSVYYHGTPTKQNAESIWKNGLDPSYTEIKYKNKKGSFLKPASGRVYLSQTPKAACAYALGGNFGGTDNKNLKSDIEINGEFGYVFEFSGEDLTDIQPDEDDVGKFISYYLRRDRKWIQEKYPEIIKNGHVAIVADWALRLYSRRTIINVMNGDVIWWAKIGKGLVRRMVNAQKLAFIKLGAHVANDGKIIPTKMYKISRLKTKELEKDYSNFFNVAELIRER